MNIRRDRVAIIEFVYFVKYEKCPQSQAISFRFNRWCYLSLSLFQWYLSNRSIQEARLSEISDIYVSFLLNHLKFNDIFCNFIPITMCTWLNSPPAFGHIVCCNKFSFHLTARAQFNEEKTKTETSLKSSYTVAEHKKLHTFAKQTNDCKNKNSTIPSKKYVAHRIQERRCNITKIEINYFMHSFCFEIVNKIKRKCYPFHSFYFLIS